MALGYAGYAKIAGDNTSTAPSATGPAPGVVGSTGLTGYMLLANTTGLEVQVNPILSTAVFGSGWYNAAQTTNYADNQLTYQGPIEFDLQGSGNIWAVVRNWGITNRAFPASLELSPDGSVVYQYVYSAVANFDGAWNQAMSLRFSPEALTKASVTAVALKRIQIFNDIQYFGNVTGTGDGPQNPLNPSTTNGRNLNPIPGWNTNAQFVHVNSITNPPTAVTGSEAVTSITQWDTDYNADFPIDVMDYNFDITNNTVIIKTCNGKRVPSAVLQGTINTTGSVTLFREGGIKDPVQIDANAPPPQEMPGYWWADSTRLLITIGGTVGMRVVIPYVLITSSDYGVRGQNEPSTRVCNFQGLGNGLQPPVLFF